MFKNIPRFFVFLSLAFSIYSLALPYDCYAGFRGKVNSGNHMFNKKDYQGAFEKYRDALIDEPESKELHFNLGDTLYKLENYEESIKEFEKATYSKDIKIQSKSYYNMGNCLYKSGKLPESIQFYKKALELNPKDDDAKYNIEFVQKKIKENLKNQPQKNDKQQQNKNQDKNKSQENKQEKDRKEKEKQEQQQKEQEKKKEKSKEEAKQMLKAFDENEKDAQKKRMKVPAQGQAEFDW